MDQTSAPEDKKAFFRNDRALVCSMLVVYSVCILGLIGATFWGLDQRNKRISVNATSTALVVATQQAKVTATAVARATEQSQYELIDRFDTNENNWRTGYEYSKYWNGATRIEDGVYFWDIAKTKDTFISWADFSTNDHIEDFDVYVDTKVVEGALGDVCSGLIFRKSPDGWEKGGYYFSLCNNSLVIISYHTEKDGWQRIATLPYYANFSDWNRLGIIARGSHFIFLVNSNPIYEMDDDRQEVGGLALVIELNEKNPAKVMFDNFGYQSR